MWAKKQFGLNVIHLSSVSENLWWKIHISYSIATRVGLSRNKVCSPKSMAIGSQVSDMTFGGTRIIFSDTKCIWQTWWLKFLCTMELDLMGSVFFFLTKPMIRCAESDCTFWGSKMICSVKVTFPFGRSCLQTPIWNGCFLSQPWRTPNLDRNSWNSQGWGVHRPWILTRSPKRSKPGLNYMENCLPSCTFSVSNFRLRFCVSRSKASHCCFCFWISWLRAHSKCSFLRRSLLCKLGICQEQHWIMRVPTEIYRACLWKNWFYWFQTSLSHVQNPTGLHHPTG